MRPICKRAGVLARPGHDGGDGRIEALEDEVGGGTALQGQAGVDDIAAGQAVVEVAALLADRLGDLGDEGDDVVVGRALQLVDALDVDPGPGLDDVDGSGAGCRPARPARASTASSTRSMCSKRLLLGPQRRHLGQRVALDHASPRGLGRRSWRTIVWVRSGPTLTMATGAPASASMAST